MFPVAALGAAFSAATVVIPGNNTNTSASIAASAERQRQAFMGFSFVGSADPPEAATADPAGHAV
jgi:hypothetical protein